MSRYATPLCPTDAGHGHVIDWATERAAFFCPHRAHVGGATGFFTTDLVPVPRTRLGFAPPAPAASPRSERARRRGV